MEENEKRLCPFRKRTTSFETPYSIDKMSEEFFLPCIGEECMAYREGCLRIPLCALMNNEKN